MAHSATTVILGTTKSNVKEVSNHAGVIAAGLGVHLKSDNTLSLAAADGGFLGVSLGRSLSDTSRTAIAREGLDVPILLTNGFTPAIGAQVAISTTTGKAKAYTGTGDAYVNAIYKSSTLTAIDEDGAVVADGCALIDMQGGL